MKPKDYLILMFIGLGILAAAVILLVAGFAMIYGTAGACVSAGLILALFGALILAAVADSQD